MAASKETKGYLTNKQIVRLAVAISANNMAVIAEGYMDIPSETIKNKKYENKDDAEAFNREIIKYWCNKNSDNTQIQRLGSLLREAISENSYGNPRDIEKILGVSLTEDVAAVKSLKEEELNELADDLRPWTEQAMKIELAPWAESLTGNMETLYTELKIEETQDTPAGEKCTPITDYKDLFEDVTKTSKPKRKRILGKGDPGIGKTTLSKKAAWDWAKGIFTVFSIVFFVSMKLIQPGDTIENMIIQQTPVLQGLNVTEEKLKHILNTFGSNCLIILDGYDEYASKNKENKNVMMLFKGQMFPRCSVLLTSRPHCVADIKVHFQSVFNIKGFTKELAHKFASDALIDPSQVDSVLEIQCVNVGDHLQGGDSLYASPMLLLFICILVNNQDIDPKRKKITVGEIFWKLIQCIYRRYCVNVGKAFIESQFQELLQKISYVAYNTYMSGEYFKREDIFSFLGSDAFSYGFLIGREDTRMTQKISTELFVTFPHRSIEEFFCCFYMVTSYLSLPWSRFIATADILECLTNPLLFQFCLWFMNCGKTCCPHLICRPNIVTALQSQILKLFDFIQLGLQDIGSFYRGINVRSAAIANDESALGFFKEVFEQCKRTKYLMLPPSTVVWALATFRPVLKQLSVLTIQSHPYFKHDLPMYFGVVSEAKPEELTLIIRGNCKKTSDEIMHYPEISGRQPSVYMHFDRCHDLSAILHKDMKELHLKEPYGRFRSLAAKQDIQTCPRLTALSFTSVEVDPSVWSVLSIAVSNGKFPCLSHLSFSDSGTATTRHLSTLFSCEWPTLKHLNFNKCELAKTDVNHLAKHHTSRLPIISSLVLHFGKVNKSNEDKKLSPFASILLGARQKGEMNVDLAIKILFYSPWPTLTRLFLHDLTAEAYRELLDVISRDRLPNLEKLGLSLWNLAAIISSHFEPLELKQGAKLVELSLQKFFFRGEYFSILASRQFFAQLRKLDISHSFGVKGNLSLLLCHDFPDLHTLILNDCELMSEDLRSLAKAKQVGRFPKLTTLEITGSKDSVECLFYDSCTWKNLLKLKISHHVSTPQDDKRQLILKAEALNSLEEFSVSIGNSEVIPLCVNKKWTHLKILTVMSVVSDRNPKVLVFLINAVERGVFPSLRVVRLVGYVSRVHIPDPPDGALRLRLRQSNIIVQYYCLNGGIDCFGNNP